MGSNKKSERIHSIEEPLSKLFFLRQYSFNFLFQGQSDEVWFASWGPESSADKASQTYALAPSWRCQNKGQKCPQPHQRSMSTTIPQKMPKIQVLWKFFSCYYVYKMFFLMKRTLLILLVRCNIPLLDVTASIFDSIFKHFIQQVSFASIDSNRWNVIRVLYLSYPKNCFFDRALGKKWLCLVLSASYLHFDLVLPSSIGNNWP